MIHWWLSSSLEVEEGQTTNKSCDSLVVVVDWVIAGGGRGTTNESYNLLVVVVPHIIAVGGRGTTNKSYNSLVVMVPCIVVIVIPGVGSGGHQPKSVST